jgi:hypothetical protein
MNRIFKKEDIKIIDWNELHGKTLKILVQNGEIDEKNITFIWGKDKNGTLYLLHEEGIR